MGRPPCCDKIGIKKGPWTPEEDILLVSYIQEHGPRNWRSVPTNAGLMRCSKSCRLRWTNYLRPGIKRGNFTRREEGIIIHLQSLLGNRWAAIASYLPQRTDNDIKNYWNTHLKKKLQRLESTTGDNTASLNPTPTTYEPVDPTSKCYNTEETITNNNSAAYASNHQTSATVYASSTENISKLLQGFMRSTPKVDIKPIDLGKSSNEVICQVKNDHIEHEEMEPMLEFDSSFVGDSDGSSQPHLSVLEKWLLDEAAGQVDLLDLSSHMF